MESIENTVSVFAVLGASGCGVLIALLASGIASLTSLIELVALRRRWLLRHTLWLGVFSPLAISTIGSLIAARRFFSSYGVLSLQQPVAPLVAFIYLSSILGLISASLGVAVHILTMKIAARPGGSSTQAKTPDDRNS